MNETIRRFGYPATLVAEYDHWLVLLRPEQHTLGSLVLAARSDAEAFSDPSSDGFAELAGVIAAIQQTLRAAVDYARIDAARMKRVELPFEQGPAGQLQQTFRAILGERIEPRALVRAEDDGLVDGHGGNPLMKAARGRGAWFAVRQLSMAQT